MAALLSLRAIGKSYGAVVALSAIDLDIDAGDVVGLCGDNGAGKSTLIRIISGALPPSAGEMRLDGRPVAFASPAAALESGVATIYQDLALAPRLAVYQNIFMGAEHLRRFGFLRLLDKRRMRAESAHFLARLNVDLPDVDRPVSDLSGGQRQAVAICRALRWNARLVVMDEPTAALGVRETRQVLDLIRELHAQGVTILIVSHNMDDLVAVTNRVVLLKNGRKIGECRTAAATADDLAHMIASGVVP
ncbi:MAG: sugar ABC transporter ATP-binding protein [Proteobacteria bacterium]|nr:sugar ABC transporter ATP-binding protein [Pseudomonadota bacterium]